MREIKFKFLLSNGEITGPYTIDELLEGMVNTDIEYLMEEHCQCFNENQNHCECEEIIIIEKLQYIGKKDKNDNEIYEGDSVYVSGQGNSYVKYFYDMACFGLITNDDKIEMFWN